MKKKSPENREPVHGSVTLFIRSKKYTLNGQWLWEMQSEAIYASDVMDFPQDFEGTKGIVHPDDLSNLSGALELLTDGELAALDFRIITTYGEVKTVNGQKVNREEAESESTITAESIGSVETLHEFALQKEAEFLRQRTAMADAAERLFNIGSWAINKSTGEAWYSDGVYRIYGLPPQSLNAHANTFHSFLHPEDRLPFLDAFETAYEAEVPVHLEYRVRRAGDEVITIRLITHWSYNNKGQAIFAGVLHDTSEEATLMQQSAGAEGKAQLHQQVLRFSENHWNTGYFFTDLLTRKTTYSDNYYRIYGLKQRGLTESNAIINLVHPDDRQTVRGLMEKMYREHVLPENEFRIIRSDGKQRILKQAGKVFVSDANLVMVGIVQDITVQHGLERKIAELNEKMALGATLQELAERTTETSFIVWYPDNVVHWSDGLYRLLGYKPDSLEPSPALLHRQIHPHDVKAFKDAELLCKNNQNPPDLRFRITNKGGVRQLQISFNRINSGNREMMVGVIKDLTKDEALQQKLTETTAYGTVLGNTISDLVILTDMDNTVLHWNRAAEEKTAIPASEALYSNLFDLFPSLKEEQFIGCLQNAASGNAAQALHVRNLYLRKAHHYYLTPLRNESGEVNRILHVVQDVSKELELQQRLSERLNFIESLVEASVDRIVVLDRHMNYIYWNKKAEEYYAINKQRVIGHNILEVFPGFRNDPDYGEFRKVLKGETIYLPPRLTDGGTDYFETYLIPVKDAENEVVAILWIVHDLSKELELQKERNQANEKIAEQAQHLQRIVQTVPDIVSIFELKTGRFTFLNPETMLAEGFDPEELAERKLDDSNQPVHPDDREVVASYFLQFATASDEDIITVEYRAKTKTGDWNWFLARGKVFKRDDEGNASHVLNAVENVTQRKNAEAEAGRKQELLQATMDSTLDMIQVFKAVRNEEGEIVDFRYILLNHEAEKWMPDAIGKSLLHLQPGVLKEGIFDAFKQVVETGIPKQYEKHYVHEQFNGWFYQSVVKMDDGVATTTSNITNRKTAELEVQQSKTLLQNIIDAPNIGMAVYKAIRNKRGEIIDFVHEYINRASIKMLGGEDFTGRLFTDHGENALAQMPKFIEVIETGRSNNYVREADLLGRKFWFAITNTPLGEDRLVHTWEDVTERKNAEAEILRLKDEVAQKATDKYHTIFNSIEEGFCIYELLYDDKGKPIDLRWVEVNPAYAKQTGLKHVVGKKHSELGLQTEQYWLDIYDNIATTGESSHFQNWHEPTQRWYHVFASRVSDAVNNQVAVVFEDITERKQQERHQAFLLKFSDTLRTEPGANAIANRAVQMLADHLQLDRCYVGIALLDDNLGIFPYQFGNEKVPPMPEEGVRLSDFPDALRKTYDETLVIEDFQNVEGLAETEKQNFAALGFGALVVANVRKELRNPDWSINAVSAKPRRWTQLEIQLIEEVTERTWAAVERAKAEEALRNSEEKYRTLFNSIDEGFSILELIFDDSGKVVDFIYQENNPAFITQVGLDLQGKRRSELSLDKKDFLLEKYDYLIKTGEPLHFEYSVENLGRQWFQVTAARIEGGGNKHIGVIFRNITERKQAEQRQAYLLKLSDAIRFIEDAVSIEETVTNIALDHFAADRCYYCTIENETVTIKRDAVRGDLPSVVGIYPLQSFALFRKAIDEGVPLIVDDSHTTEILDERLRQIVIGLQIRSYILIPVIKNGKAVGLFCLVQSTLRNWKEAEVELATETAERTWASVERARAEERLKKFASQLEEEVIKRTATLRHNSEELQKNITILQQAESLAMMGSWEYKNDSGKFTWSEGMYRLFGLPQGTAVKPEIYLDFAVEEDRAIAKRIIKNLKKGQQDFEEIMRIRKNAEIRLLKIKGAIAKDESGRPQGVIGVDVDITDIKAAEEKIQQVQHWLQQTALASPDAINVYDLINKQPVYLNNCLATWLGLTSDEMVKMGIDGRLQYVHPEDRLRLLHFNEKLKGAKDGDVLSLEYRLRSRDEKLLWVNNRSKVFQRNEKGEVTHVLSILQDITDEKAAKEVLNNLNASLEKKNKELEEKNEEITSFAFVASHDLREPLRKIQTFSDWLLTRETMLSETGKEHLQRMNSAVKRLSLLIDDVLALTKMQVDNERASSIHLNILLQRLQEEIHEKISRTNAIIETDKLPAVSGAENQLFYLFKNLISNAIKFQAAGNQPHIRINAEQEAGYIKISVVDNGIGIAAEHHKKIFEMFRRLHGRHEYEGTGMGLSICRKIMEKHGGKITVESKEGEGATFICWFPVSLLTT